MNGFHADTTGDQRMSQALLSGWTMLAETCSSCHYPLMRSRAGETICVNCPPGGGESDGEGQKEEGGADEDVEAARVAIAESEERKRDVNDVSQMLGSLLLQGHTMLAESCTDCRVPLMRSRGGDTICVSCGLKFDSEGQAVTTQSQTSRQPPGDGTTRAVGPPLPSAAAISASKESTIVFSEAVNTAEAKLHQATVHLSAASDATQIRQWAQAVEALALALNALK
jgi:uncharacterized Zn finger protein (UPF0148 family)